MKNYSYATLLTSDKYFQGVVLLEECLKKVNSKYPLLCVYTEDVSKELIEKLESLDVKCQLVEDIETPDIIYQHNLKISQRHADTWKHTFTKFKLWTLTDYDKLVYLDADLLILKNLDHCFEMRDGTAARDGDYFSIWPKNKFFNSGFMVIEPDAEFCDRATEYVNDLDPESLLDPTTGCCKIVADQDVLNELLTEWRDDDELQLSKYYNVFAPYVLKDHESDLLQNAYFIHFVGIKPWETDDVTQRSPFARDALALNGVRSKLFYEQALTIISLVYQSGFKHVDWSDVDGFNAQFAEVCYSFYGDEDKANALWGISQKDSSNIDEYDLDVFRKEVLMPLLTYAYKRKLVTNAYLFESLCQASDNNKRELEYWARELEELIKRIFINY